MSSGWPETFWPFTMTTGAAAPAAAPAWPSCCSTAARLPLPGVSCWPLMVMTCGLAPAAPYGTGGMVDPGTPVLGGGGSPACCACWSSACTRATSAAASASLCSSSATLSELRPACVGS